VRSLDDERSPDESDAAQIVRWLNAYRSGSSLSVPTSDRRGFRWAYENDAAWRILRTSGETQMPRVDVEALMVEARGPVVTEARYSDNQPRDDDGQFAKGGGSGAGTGPTSPSSSTTAGADIGASGTGPLTDEQFAARTTLVSNVMNDARKTLSTDITHTDEHGGWDPERDALHREVAAALYAKAANVPTDGQAVIAGGLGGAGKSTVLRKFANIDQSKYLTVNPDDIKEELARRGKIPEVPGHPELSPMERAPLVHEESSRIARMVADRAYADRRNMIWDITMSSQASVESRVTAMRGAGYTGIKGIFVDVPVESSASKAGAVERAMTRYRSGVDQFNAGSGLGGRFVPPSVIRAQLTSTGATVNREVFDAKRDIFDSWSVYDNSTRGGTPKLVASGGTG
jgi:hypothetical protein